MVLPTHKSRCEEGRTASDPILPQTNEDLLEKEETGGATNAKSQCDIYSNIFLGGETPDGKVGSAQALEQSLRGGGVQGFLHQNFFCFLFSYFFHFFQLLLKN